MKKEQEVIERLKYDISAGEYSTTKTELLETALIMIKEKDKQIDFYKKGLEKEIDSNRENIMEIIKKDKIIDLMTECSVICGLERLLDYLAKKHIYYAQFKNTTIMHEGKDGNVENFYIRRSKE